MLELSVLLISIFIIVIILYINNKYNNVHIIANEGFENYYLKACPNGYKSFYNNDGDIICCDGNIVANKCLSDNQCTLNGKGTPDMPNCVQAILKMYADKGQTQCPSSMPTYYEDRVNNIKACTQGRLNDTLNAPQFATQTSCTIYDKWDTNLNSKNSCFNQKQLDSAECFGNNCTKEIVQPNPNAPPLIAIGFIDTMGIHRVAYTRQSLENFLNVTNPSWRNKGVDLSKNITVAEVAKAYYIDKTIDQSQIMM
jgi:hypothetical protein